MMLREILQAKGTEVHSTVPSAPLSEVVDKLVAHNCGSLVVLEEEGSQRMVGIITERDILRACAGNGEALCKRTVQEVMTTDASITRSTTRWA